MGLSDTGDVEAQTPGLFVKTDKTKIKIGEQININWEARFPANAGELIFTGWPDSMEHFELIQMDKKDSVIENNHLVGLKQHLIITSYDTGIWKMPAISYSFKYPDSDSTHHSMVDSIPVEVRYSTSDTIQQLKDIKPIREVVLPDDSYYWIAGISAAIILLLLLIVWWVKRRQHKKGKFADSSVNPLEEAMRALKLLEDKPLEQPHEILLFHTELSDILRKYLSRKLGGDFFSKTSGDILMILRNSYLDSTIFSHLAAALRLIDATKFAKYRPQESESRSTATTVSQVIQTIESVTNNKQS